jgi:hypothetical protein
MVTYTVRLSETVAVIRASVICRVNGVGLVLSQLCWQLYCSFIVILTFLVRFHLQNSSAVLFSLEFPLLLPHELSHHESITNIVSLDCLPHSWPLLYVLTFAPYELKGLAEFHVYCLHKVSKQIIGEMNFLYDTYNVYKHSLPGMKTCT